MPVVPFCGSGYPLLGSKLLAKSSFLSFLANITTVKECPMTQINALIDIVGPSHVLTGGECEKYSSDWFKLYPFTPLAVVRPANVHQVSEIVK